MISSINELLQREAQAVLNIPVTDAYEKAVALIVEQVHRKRGKLVTSGMGKAGQIAMNIATTFCSTGIPSVFFIRVKHSMGIWAYFRKMIYCCSFPIQEKRARLWN